MTGTGFSPDEPLVVTECAAKGTSAGPGDCNLSDLQSVISGASGRVSVSFPVIRGSFRADHVVCGPTQACLVSVTQASPSPTQEANTQISFK